MVESRDAGVDELADAQELLWAPWYVLPPHDKKVMQALASAVIVDAEEE